MRSTSYSCLFYTVRISLFLGRGSLVSNPSIFPSTCKICGSTMNVCFMKLGYPKDGISTIPSKKFFPHLKKYNIYLEKKIIEYGNDIQRIGCLRKGNIIATSPMDKANLKMMGEPLISSFLMLNLCKTFLASAFLHCTDHEVARIFLRYPRFRALHNCAKNGSSYLWTACISLHQSLTQGEVPSRWKHSFVTPILEKEPSCSPENYPCFAGSLRKY
ncbi:hypothetical protein COOONC_03702 [Cooperia oncophora]